MTHHAERALFDLRRGRPVFVGPRPDEDPPPGGTAAVVAVVEGLERSILERLERAGGPTIRLVVTPQRARRMAAQDDVSPSATVGEQSAVATNGKGFAAAGLSLGRGPEVDEIVRLASAVRTSPPGRLERLPPGTPESAALELVRRAGLLPALVSVRTTPRPSGELAAALESGAMLRATVRGIEAFTTTSSPSVRRVSEAPVPLESTEEARFVLFRERGGLRDHVAIVVGEPGTWPDPVPVRLHSACLTGDLFGSLRCDCGEQLRRSLGIVAAQGGVLLYLAQEGRSIGLANKLRAYAIQEGDLDTVDANCTLGFGADERRYAAAVEILRRLGVERVRLLTNNPEKLRAVEAGGVRVVERHPLHGTLNRHNLPYVAAKAHRIGHWLEEMLSSKLPDT